MRSLYAASLAAIALSLGQPAMAQDTSATTEAQGAAIAPLPAQWIWDERVDEQATNRFTWFRRALTLDDPPAQATLFFAADANAQIWLNGEMLRRKVTRYTVDAVRPEAIDIGPFLRAGENELLVLHHNWGPGTNFQREPRRRGGLYVSTDSAALAGLATGSGWQSAPATAFLEHDLRIMGLNGKPRIRFPVTVDGRRLPVHAGGSAQLDWQPASAIADPIWTIATDERIRGQREYPLGVERVIAAGRADYGAAGVPAVDDPRFAAAMEDAVRMPDPALAEAFAALPRRADAALELEPGETQYATFDFHRPLHGFPYIELATDTPGVIVSFGYGELNVSPKDGSDHIDPDSGRVLVEGVSGQFYGDRYVTAGTGRIERIEFPDERTARYMMVDFTAPAGSAASLAIADLGIVRSQAPVSWRGTFDGGDLRLEQLVELAKEHAELNMTDTYVDTPGREDAAWLDDIRLRGQIADRWTGEDSQLRRLVILHHEESRTPDGRFLAFAPQSHNNDLSQWDWGMQWISLVLDEWNWTGDRAFLADRWDALDTYVTRLMEQVDADGRFRTNYLFADIRGALRPRTRQDVSAIGQGQLVIRLRQAARIAGILGEGAKSREWRDDADRLAEAMRRDLWVEDEAGGYFADVWVSESGQAIGRSQAPQVIAAEAGLFAPGEARAVLGRFFPAPFGKAPEGTEAWNVPTYSHRVAARLAEAGLAERAVSHLLWRYDPYLPFSPSNPADLRVQGPMGGPLPEYFRSYHEFPDDPEKALAGQPNDPTGSHGWAAMPLLFFHDTLLGVTWKRADDGTLAHIAIAPKSGGLPIVQGWTMTPAGAVNVDWDERLGRLELILPGNAPVLVEAPGEGRSWLVERENAGLTVATAVAGGASLSGAGRVVLLAR